MSFKATKSCLESFLLLSESAAFSFDDDLEDLFSESFPVLDVLDDLEHLDEGEYDS